MTTKYADEIEGAASDIADAGAPITFTRTTDNAPGAYNPSTDTSYAPAVNTATGVALRVKPRFRDVMEWQASSGLVLKEPVTLIVAAAGLAFDPQPGDTFVWGGITYSCRWTDPFAPDGATILYRLLGSR